MTMRTWELTDETIEAFSRDDIKTWMDRIMRRLYTSVKDKSIYNNIASKLVLAARKSLSELKSVLIKAVFLIKEARQNHDHLMVVN